MVEPSSGDGFSQIGRHVMHRHGFVCLMYSISSDPSVVVAIPDDDV